MLNPKYCNHWVKTEKDCVPPIKKAIEHVAKESYLKRLNYFSSPGSDDYILLIKANDEEWYCISDMIRFICNGRRLDIL